MFPVGKTAGTYAKYNLRLILWKQTSFCFHLNSTVLVNLKSLKQTLPAVS